MHRAVAALSIPLLLVSHLLAAQSVQPLGGLLPGARVRLTIAGQPRRTATLLGSRADSLLVRWTESPDSVAVPFVAVSRLEASAGKQRSMLRNAGYGALIGSAAGMILGAVSYTPCTRTEVLSCYLEPENRAQAGLWGASAAGAVGLIVGTLTGVPKRERWQRVATPATRVAVSIAPAGRGARLRVAARF